MVSDSLESEIESVARGLASAGEGKQVGAFHLGWWSEQMLEWAFTHPEFKTQLFRFVDVFPRCRDAGDVLRHMSEYFDGVPVPRGSNWVSTSPSRCRSAASSRLRWRAATSDAWPDSSSSAPIRSARSAGLRRLWDQGEAITVDLLGEKVVSEAEADRYASRVVEVLDVLVTGTPSWPAREQLEHDPWGALPRADVSVKPTALTALFAPLTGPEALDAAMARLRPVLDRARRDVATVHLDTEHDEAKDLGYELLRRMGSEYPDVQLGCVVQAYRRDSFADLRDLIAWSADRLEVPLRVRLVKGAYWDHEQIVAGAAGWPLPVFARKPETDANFERCTKYLIDHAGEVRPAIASHNLRSLAHAIVLARRCELGDPLPSSSSCCTAWPSRSTPRSCEQAIGCACTHRSAIWFLASPISCDGCSRTRPTRVSSAIVSRKAVISTS